MAEHDLSNQAVKPDRFILALVNSSAAVLGSAPYLLFVGALWLLPVPALIGAVTALFSGRKERARAASRPTTGEWLAAFWGQVGLYSLTGMALMVHLVTYWLSRLLFWILGLVGLSIEPATASTIALCVSAFLAVSALFATTQAWDPLVGRLYPRAAGVRSPYHAAWQDYGMWILGAIAVGIAAVGVALTITLDSWYWVGGLAAYLFYSGFPLAMLGDRRERRRSEGIKAVQRLLTVGGWRVDPVPETGDPEVDPILGDIDFVARRGGETLAIEVKAADVDWTVASGLRMAARVMEVAVAEDGGPPVAIRPVLVLVGVGMSQSLRRFAEGERFQVVTVTEQTVREVIREGSDERLKVLADEVRMVPEGENG